MSSFTLLFLALLLVGSGLQLYLAWRHGRHVAAHRDAVPSAFVDRISLQEHQLAADYTTAKVRLELVGILWSSLLLLLWTLGGGLQWLDQRWDALELSPLWHGTGFMLSALLLMGLLDLPLSLYRTFVIEQRFGFNKSSWALWIGDLFKSTLLSLLIGVPLLLLVLWLMGNAGPLWWLWVWLVWSGFGLLMLWAYPAFIAPLFNKFSNLENPELESAIRDLLTRCGFAFQGVFVMDGSRRSSHGNAYFTGLGNNKRIVFYDTLLKALGQNEIVAVLAHELGHFRRKHVRQRMIIMFASSFLGLALLGWLSGQSWFFNDLGLTTPSLHGALMLFLLVVPVFTFFTQPLLAAHMRKHEFEADDFAAAQSDARDLIRALVKLYQDNASTLTPDPWYSAFHDSHPPAAVRIDHLSARIAP